MISDEPFRLEFGRCFSIRFERLKTRPPRSFILELSQPTSSIYVPAVKHVCVLGAGTMGAGIAAHLANMGFGVSLVDVSRERAEEGVERNRTGPRPTLMTTAAHAGIETSGLGELEAILARSQWVCEAVAERMDIKQELWARVDAAVGPEALLTTNTSGLPISQLSAGRSADFKKRFVGAHFFNPPRYLKLLELIPTDETDPDLVDQLVQFFETRVARRVVRAKDTPGFIANRFGMWALFQAIHTAEKLGFSVEQGDLFSGELLGRPRSGTFGLADLIGVDVMIDIARGLLERCPHDEYAATLDTPKSLLALWSNEWLGDKTGHGYYRKQSKDVLTLDLATRAYRVTLAPQTPPAFDGLRKLPLAERIPALLDTKDEAGEFARNHLLPILRYANAIKDEISYSVRDFDRVMRWGWGWEAGPFEIIDMIGAEKLGLANTKFYEGGRFLSADGHLTTPKPEPEYLELANLPVVDERPTFRVRELGDGVLLAGITTKMGIITPDLVRELTEFISLHKSLKLVLTSEARSFSAGFDITFLQKAIEDNNRDSVEPELHALQTLGEKLSEIGAVAAVFGHCLGAGLELALGCAHIVAAAESRIGFPEARIGLIPAGRGTVLMRAQRESNASRLAEIAISMVEGKMSNSAPEAQALGFLRPTDTVEFLPDRLLYVAKQKALKGEKYGLPTWPPQVGPLAGMIDRSLAEKRAKGTFTEYDVLIGERIKGVFVRSNSYAEALVRERTEFIELLGRQQTQLRIKHMLEQGTPLRN